MSYWGSSVEVIPNLVRIAGLFIALTGVLSCASNVVEEFERPTAPVKASFKAAPVTDLDAADIIHPEWWQGFADEPLNELIVLAADNNLELANQLLEIEKAGITLKGAKVDPFLPNANISLGKGVENNKGTPTQSSLNIGWEFDFIGGLEKQKRGEIASYANFLGTEANQRAFYLSLVSNIGNRYFQIRSFDDSLALLANELTNLRKTVRIEELKFREGLVAASALNLRKVQLSELENRQINLQQQRDSEELELALLLGMVPGEYQINPGPSLYNVRPIPIPATAPAYIIENRPDVIAAEQALLAAHEQVNLARLDRLPSLTISLSVTQNLRQSMANMLSNLTKSLASNLNIIPFDSRKTRALESRTIEQKQAANSYRQTILTAFKEVEQALILYDSLQRQDESLQQQLRFLEKALGTENSRLSAGLVSQFEVIETENKVLAARQALYQNHLQILTASIGIYKSLGGGWSNKGSG